MPDDRLETALDVMADMVFDPAFADVDAEREVVLEEIAMVEDNPQDLVHDVVAEAVFGGHPLGRPVIGRADGDLVASRGARSPPTTARRTSADNVVVAAAGNVDARAPRSSCSQRASPGAGGAAAPRRASRSARPPPPGFRFQRKADRAVPRLSRRARASRARDERRFAASLLDAILGGSASSRLFQEIREKRGMAYSVYSFASQYADSGQVGIYVGTREENLGAVPRDRGAASSATSRPGTCGRASWSGRRRT